MKYKTDRIAEVGRLVAGLEGLGRRMCRLPVRERERERDGKGNGT